MLVADWIACVARLKAEDFGLGGYLQKVFNVLTLIDYFEFIDTLDMKWCILRGTGHPMDRSFRQLLRAVCLDMDNASALLAIELLEQ